eukprot:scaffold249_cov132-Isochrysis_galbana.AAC.9
MRSISEVLTNELKVRLNLKNPEGCCSGQPFAVVVMGGAATPKEGVFAALTTHAKSRSSGQWTGRAPAVRCAGSGRAPGYRAAA